MAISAFKSTSKRGNLATPSASSSSSSSSNGISHFGTKSIENPAKRVPSRRSRSVSALARHHELEIPSDFLNKRDNPLFLSSGSPRECEILSETTLRVAKVDEAEMGFGGRTSKVVGSGGGGGGAAAGYSRRGRSVSRNADARSDSSGGRVGIGRRSLLRIDNTGRRGRSLSQRPISRARYETSESEVELECSLSGGPATVQPSAGSASCIKTRYREDGFSKNALPDAEEKTIKAVFEQMKSAEDDQFGIENTSSGIYETVRSEVRRAISDIQTDLESAIRRHNASTLVATNVADIPPDLVNPGAVELVLDIRREYARKLDESQQRASKLRSDLAVEEHREQELSRILKDILPDPKSNVQKSRPVRKTSIERKKISKRLTEEAMAYFDECVSISTFDSSDFSAPEDPPVLTVGTTTLEGKKAAFPQGSPSVSTAPNSCLNLKQEFGSQEKLMHSHERSYLTAGSSNDSTSNGQWSPQGFNMERSRKPQFSFARKVTIQHDIRNYVKNFEKGSPKDGTDSEVARSNYYDADEYTSHAQTQTVLFDRVLFKNGVESGSLLLCSGGTAISFSPFASIM